MTGNFKYNADALKNIKKFLNSNYRVRIGVLSDQKRQSGKFERKIGPVELAAVHEFGSARRKIPERSFLRKTMRLRQNDFKATIAANYNSIFNAIIEGNFQYIFQRIGAIWVSYVQEAFESGGPGWPRLAKRTLSRRRKAWTGDYKRDKNGNLILNRNGKPKKEMAPSHKILWVTGALARSITWQVKK